MTWTQAINPLGNPGLSALVDALPIIFLFCALAIWRMKGYIAGLITLSLALVLAIVVHGMPANMAFLTALYGAMVGLFPIGWIVVTAVFLYNLTVKTGQFEIIKDSIASITEDRRLQALLIAFSFGAFLEGAAGFGTPVAITAAMLAGLGFNPLYAAGICLIANTAPVAFGGIGIPIITAGAVTGIDAMAISQMVGRQLPFLSVFVPFWLVFIMAGWRGAMEVMPAILVSGVSFAVAQWFSSNYMTPMLPDILSSLVSIVALVFLLRVWKPKKVWRFADEPQATLKVKKHSAGAVLKAWSPFIVLTVLISDWGLKPVKAVLDTVSIKIVFSGLDQAIIAGGKPMSVVYNFNWLSAGGTAILISAIISAMILRIGPGQFLEVFARTLKDLRFALLTIASVLGFAFVANWSGMTPTLGKAFTVTGSFFPFVAPILGWLGVVITGSDTSSNALFCKMQQITAEQIGVNPVLTVAANSSGGVAGKMISPQSIAVGAAATGLVGREGDLFRFTLAHSIFFALIISMITYLQAYVLTWMIPPLTMASTAAATAKAVSGGTTILMVTGIFIVILGLVASRQRSSLDALNGRRSA
ncbi:L-lactate permease [Desulfofundulus salinus]|uniref:L-lactate permease n=1 Tax=Desulfofundulus salinus TaxID=2419843 RepID=A0A494WUC3_9FIRM|nr:lactate permease LctP family transporter [Desulfofundulus salinum]RKO66443.1 L-lactate permease [Desulfofundulus salinum]